MDSSLASEAIVKTDFACSYMDNKAHKVSVKDDPNMRFFSMNNFPPD